MENEIALHSNATVNLMNDTKGFELLSQIIKETAGIHLPLSDKNLSLMSARLWPTLRSLQFVTYKQYHDYLKSNGESALLHFVSQMTTNTTHFFREDAHFTILRDLILEELKKKTARKREYRLWCAACSTGQEAYTLAMVLAEVLGLALGQFRILATDIDHVALEKADAGIYTKEEVSSIPPLTRNKYFVESSDRQQFRVRTQLRSTIEFGEFNLQNNDYPFTNLFDTVFCRNVLIYFERAQAQMVINKLTNALVGDGHLFLGHSESGIVKNSQLISVASAAYRRVIK